MVSASKVASVWASSDSDAMVSLLANEANCTPAQLVDIIMGSDTAKIVTLRDKISLIKKGDGERSIFINMPAEGWLPRADI